MDRGAASSSPVVAQYQGPLDAPRRFEERREERGESASSDAAAAPSAVFFTHQGEASTYVQQQRTTFPQQGSSTESEKEEKALGKLAYLSFPSAKHRLVAMRDRYCNDSFSIFLLQCNHLWPR